MASENGSIRYSDLIIPDDAITDLIAQLEKLNSTYDGVVKDIQAKARQMEQALKGVSGATMQGQESIRRMAEQAERLNEDYKAAKTVADATAQQAKSYKELEQAINRIIGTQEENSRAMAEHARLVAQARAALNAYQKALDKGGRLTAEETAQYGRLNKEIAEHTAMRNQARTALNQSVKAMQAEEGSIAQLREQLNQLNNAYVRMSAARREGAEGTEMIRTIQKQYAELSKLEQAMGNWRRNVGNYASSWDGLGMSVQQVVRELPSLSMGFDMFFLAISNNLPMLIDEIKIARAEFERLNAAGQAATPVWKQLLRSVGNWVTFVVAALALLASYGDEIIDWVKGLVGAKDELDGIRDSIIETNSQIDNEASKLRVLSERLSEAEKGSKQWKDLRNTIVSQYGKYLSGLDKEIDTVGNLSKVYNTLVDSMRKSMAMKGLKDFIDKKDAEAFKSISDSYLTISRNISKGEGFSESDVARYMKFIREFVETGEWKTFKDWTSSGKLTQDQYHAIIERIMARGGESEIYAARRAYVQNDRDKRNYATALGLSESDYDALNIGLPKNPDNLKRIEDVVNEIQSLQSEIERLREEPVINLSQIEDFQKRIESLKSEYRTMTGENYDKSGGKAGSIHGLLDSDEQDKYDKALDAQRAYQDALGELIADEYDRRRYQTAMQYDREIEDIRHRLETEKSLTEQAQKDLTAQMELLARQRNDALARIEDERQMAMLEAERRGIELRMQGLREESEQYRTLQNKLFDVDNRIALAQNAALPAGQRQDPGHREAATYNYRFELDRFDEYLEQKYDKEYDSERAKTLMRLQMERERWEMILKLTEKYGSQITGYEIGQIKEAMAGIDSEIANLGKGWDTGKSVWGNLYDLVFGDAFGKDAEGQEKSAKFQESLGTAISFAKEQLQEFLDYRAELADKAVENAEKEVDAAQSALDAERQARANGYANNVQQAQKELALAKKNQQQAIKEQQKAQKQQQAIQALEQISNMVTATSLIWSQLGFPLAIPAIAIMWASFAAAKIKSAQMAKSVQADAATETYGEGTVELLQGGSHQSGNDIDLGHKKDGTRRRAEGGEFFAVINKRSSRRFRSVIPDVINSLNNGTFADRYMNAYKAAQGLTLNVAGESPDLRRLSDDVKAIREQNRRRVYSDGTRTVTIYKNMKRIARR